MSRTIMFAGVVLVFFALAVTVAVARSVSATDDAFLSEYDGSGSSEREALVEKYQNMGFWRMLEVVERKYPECHVEAHPIGRVIFRETQNFSTSLYLCRNSCSYGCFHGVLLEAFSSMSDSLGGRVSEDADAETVMKQITTTSSNFCTQDAISGNIPLIQCVHGVGHAVTYVFEYRLSKAIEVCKKLPEWSQQNSCASGAFMEFVANHNYRDELIEKTYFPCQGFPDFSRACFRSKGSFLLEALGLEKAVAACRTLPREISLKCISGLGYAQGTPETFTDENEIERICGFGDADEKAACLKGAANNVVLNSKDTVHLCENALRSVRGYCGIAREYVYGTGIEETDF